MKKFYSKKGIPIKKIFVLEDAVNINNYNSIRVRKLRLREILNLPLNKKIILYSGSVYKDRGIKTILNAAKINKNENYFFVFIGGPKKYTRYWENYKKKNIKKENILFLGLVSYKMVPYYLKSADILLATYSFSCPTLNIMSPLKIFEYMASKVPFIATRIGRMTEICNNEECLFVNPEDPQDLIEKINLLLNDKDLQKELIENAFNKAKNNTYIKRCKKIIRLIRNNRLK